MEDKFDRFGKDMMRNSRLEINDLSFDKDTMLRIIKVEYQRKSRNLMYMIFSIVAGLVLVCYLAIVKLNADPRSFGSIVSQTAINGVKWFRDGLTNGLENIYLIVPLILIVIFKMTSGYWRNVDSV